MRLHEDLLEPLMSGLPVADQRQILLVIARTRDEQIHRKLHPPRRRRRGPDGVLRWPGELP